PAASTSRVRIMVVPPEGWAFHRQRWGSGTRTMLPPGPSGSVPDSRPAPRLRGGGGRTNSIDWLGPNCASHALSLPEEPTTTLIQRYLDAVPGDQAAEPVIRELLERAVGRLRLLCATLRHKSSPRLTRPPVDLQTDELLGGVAAGLLTAL